MLGGAKGVRSSWVPGDVVVGGDRRDGWGRGEEIGLVWWGAAISQKTSSKYSDSVLNVFGGRLFADSQKRSGQ